MRKIRILTAVFAGVLATAMLIGVVYLLCRPAPSVRNVSASEIGGSFSLVDQEGSPVTERNFLGKPSVIFFGFTNCPEVCPTTLLDLGRWLKAIGADADKLNVLFISVDPERDTPEHLKEYLSSFDTRIRGLTGTEAQVAAAAKAYRIFYKRIPLEQGGYTMDHSSAVYLMDRAGRFVEPISWQTKESIAIMRLKKLAAS